MDLLDKIQKSGVMCFDVEHAPDLSWESSDFQIHGMGVSTIWDGQIIAEYLRPSEIQPYLDLFDKVECVAHYAKADLHFLRAAGFVFPEPIIRDTAIAYNLINEEFVDRELGLKKLVKSIYGHQMTQFEDAASDGLDSEKFRKYALEDVTYELRLYLDAKPQLTKLGVWKLYEKVLCPALYVFFEMEHFGIHWDLSVSGDLYYKLSALKNRLEISICRKLGNININSAEQLAKALFEEKRYSTVGIKYLDKTRKFSVDSQSMAKLASRYPVCEEIAAYRTCVKMISTYLEPLTSKAIFSKSGRVHANFWLTSATGRVRCSDPNLQNLPTGLGDGIIHNEALREGLAGIKIRSGITAPKGCKLLVADFSQIELRIGAIVSKEKELLDAYLNWSCCCGGSGISETLLTACPKCGIREDEKAWKAGKGFWHGTDLHTSVLEHVKGPLRKAITRDHGKILNFLVLYAGGAYRLNQNFPSLSIEECETIVNSIMSGRKSLRAWHARTKAILMSAGKLQDIFGRWRRIPKSEISENFKHSLNQLVNFQVQSPTVILTLMAMVKFRKAMINLSLWGQVKLVNMVHDELVVECPENLVDTVAPHLVESMQQAVKLKIPIRAELKIVDSWGECK